MARSDGGGGGAFGWTVLGILVGVTATLAVQTLMGARGAAPSHDEAAMAAPESVTPSAPPAPRIAPRPTPANLAIDPPVHAETQAAAAQPDQQVQDDADAVGMTSRSRPSEPATPSPAGAQN